MWAGESLMKCLPFGYLCLHYIFVCVCVCVYDKLKQIISDCTVFFLVGQTISMMDGTQPE